MLKTQNLYCNYLREVGELIGTVGVSNDRLEPLRTAVAETDFLIPVIGSFSAGKSTLINSFLESDYLPVDITPETSLATELHYSESERLEAVRSDGSTDRYTVSEFTDLKTKASEYRFVRAYLNSAKLKAIQPLVLVDMPGFGSPLEQHNRAIIEYIQRGTHYIVLISVEEGTLTRSILSQVSDIYDVNKGISFFLSKANLRAPSEVNEIAENISSRLKDYYNNANKVTPIGLDAGENLAAIVEAIDPEELTVQLFQELILDAYRSCKGEINTRIVALGKTKNENENTLKNLQQGMEELTRKKNEMLTDAREKYSDIRVGRIVEKVGRALSDSADELTNTAISSGADALNREISDIVRPTLLHEIRSAMDELNDNIIADISMELRGVDAALSQYSNGDAPWLGRIVESSKILFHSSVEKLTDMKTTMSQKDGTLYKVVTTVLGLTTKILAPIVEVIIVFLPEILAGIMAKSREQKQREDVRQSILTKTIPEVKAKLRGELPDIFNEQVKKLINEISARFESQIEEQNRIISSQQSEIDARASEIEDQIGSFSAVVEELNTRTNTLLEKQSKETNNGKLY